MKYMLLICVDASRAEAPDADAADAPAEPAPDSPINVWLDAVRDMRLDGGPLLPPSEARTVRVRDGETLLGDGPFAETKE